MTARISRLVIYYLKTALLRMRCAVPIMVISLGSFFVVAQADAGYPQTLTLAYTPQFIYRNYNGWAVDDGVECLAQNVNSDCYSQMGWAITHECPNASYTLTLTPSGATTNGYAASQIETISITAPPQCVGPGDPHGLSLSHVCAWGNADFVQTGAQASCVITLPMGCDCGGSVGKPIDVYSRREWEIEPEFEDPKHILSFNRMYSSSIGSFYSDWLVPVIPDYPGTPATVFAECVRVSYSNDGVTSAQCLPLTPSGASQFVVNDVLGQMLVFNVSGMTVTAQTPDQVEQVSILGTGSSTTYRVHRPNELYTDTYIANGAPIKRAWADGRTATYTYDATGRLPIAITDNFGRQLSIAWDATGRLQSVTSPDGAQALFGYDDPASNCMGCFEPSSVTYQDGSEKKFIYNENGLPSNGLLLTGVVDELGQRYMTITYDSSNNATSSTLGTDNEDYWQVSPSQSIDPLGATRSYGFSQQFNKVRLTSETQPAGAGSASATRTVQFDSNGNPNIEVDFVGNTIHRTFDQIRNLETSRVEAYGAPEARTITTAYHPYWALKSSVAEPKKITTWVYNGQVDPTTSQTSSCAPSSALVDGQPIAVLCKQIEQPTSDSTGSAGFSGTSAGTARIWQFTYDVNGQLLTKTDPVGNITTNAYYSTAGPGHNMGDLQSVKDAKNPPTTYTSYDGAGRLLSMTDPNNVITTFTYRPRGWLSSKTVTQPDGNSLQWQFQYYADGFLEQATMPDGSYLHFSYTTAHRLQNITDSVGNEVAYTLDSAGNRTAEQTRDPSGTLRRNISRTYDVLGRVSQVTGARQ